MNLSFLFLPVLGVIGVGFFVFAVYFLRSVYKKEKEFEKKRDETFGNYDVILRDAHTKAETLLAKAAADVTSHYEETKHFDEKISQSLSSTVEAMVKQNVHLLDANSRQFIADYTASLQTMRERYEKDMDTILQDVHTSTVKDFTELKDSMRKEILEEQASIKQELQGAYADSKIEMNDYRKHRLADVDASIDALILRVVEQVMGKIILVPDHQKLVLEALEKAKTEGMFDL